MIPPSTPLRGALSRRCTSHPGVERGCRLRNEEFYMVGRLRRARVRARSRFAGRTPSGSTSGVRVALATTAGCIAGARCVWRVTAADPNHPCKVPFPEQHHCKGQMPTAYDAPPGIDATWEL